VNATLSIGDRAAQIFRDITTTGKRRPKWDTPGTLAVELDKRTVQTPALDLIDEALLEAYNTPDARLIISVPPQEGKSTRCGVFFPLWVLNQDPSKRIAMTSFSDRLARRNSRNVRNYVVSDGSKLGLTLSHDVASQTEWQVAGERGGIYAVSVGGALTGQPADLLIIDDPHKGAKEADSQLQREEVWEWWLSTASARLAPGAPVVMILTRWHEDDLAGKFLNSAEGDQWKILNIPAMADHDPEKGESDPLGREPGTFLESARKRTIAQWEAIKRRQSSRNWNALFQGRPSAVEGTIFKRTWWKRYDTKMWVEENGVCRVPSDGKLILSWDMTFKDTKASDFVVGQVWLHRGPNAYLLDQKRKRMGFTESKGAFEAMAAKWPQAAVKLIEDKANGTAILEVLRTKLPGLIAIEPKESKTARAEAVTAFIESGNVFIPEAHIAAWADEFIEEAAAFPTGAHDDQVDAMTQALNRLFISGSRMNSFMEFMKSNT
jgi:predicted phage terminase large subunit-like protein